MIAPLISRLAISSILWHSILSGLVVVLGCVDMLELNFFRDSGRHLRSCQSSRCRGPLEPGRVEASRYGLNDQHRLLVRYTCSLLHTFPHISLDAIQFGVLHSCVRAGYTSQHRWLEAHDAGYPAQLKAITGWTYFPPSVSTACRKTLIETNASQLSVGQVTCNEGI